MSFQKQYKEVTEKFLKHFGLAKTNPDIPFLTQITTATSRIPYENVTKIIKTAEHTLSGFPLRFPDEVFEDYLRMGTGGTCFSLTHFLFHLLKECGFFSYVVMADRSYGPNKHCALVVVVNNISYLVDPGYLVNKPIPLLPGSTSLMPNTINSLVVEWETQAELFRVYTLKGGQKKWRYTFKPIPTVWENFVTFWEDSFSWKGMDEVVITGLCGDKQIYMHDNQIRLIGKNSLEIHTLTDDWLMEIKTSLGIDPKLIMKAIDITSS